MEICFKKGIKRFRRNYYTRLILILNYCEIEINVGKNYKAGKDYNAGKDCNLGKDYECRERLQCGERL